jgi:hypothetical protein
MAKLAKKPLNKKNTTQQKVKYKKQRVTKNIKDSSTKIY